MKEKLIICIWLFSEIFLINTAYSENSFSAVIVDVADGDTLKISDDKNNFFIVRIYGIDAPEKKQKNGKEAKEFLTNYLKKKKLRIYKITTDRYGRLICRVEADKTDISTLMVENGFAFVYEKYCKIQFCNILRNAEAKAKSQRFGIWSDDEPEPPWRFREKKACKVNLN